MKVKILVEIEGGCVQDVLAFDEDRNSLEIELTILDHDHMEDVERQLQAELEPFTKRIP